MAQVVSATTRFNRQGGRRSDFLSRARVLLLQAREHQRAGNQDLALEYSYQAALRLAGARVAGSAVARRRRPPSDAWGKLRLVDAAGIRQAEIFEGYSRLRSRVASGIDRDPDPTVVAELMARTSTFLAEVEMDFGDSTAAA